MAPLVLQIPWPTPSANEFANKRSRWAYRTTKSRWMRRVSDAWLEQKAAHGRRRGLWLRPPGCRVRVTVERFGRQENALDRDNCKPLLDALRLLELIDDDRDRALDLVARQPKNPYRTPAMWTRVTLERLDGEEATTT